MVRIIIEQSFTMMTDYWNTKSLDKNLEIFRNYNTTNLEEINMDSYIEYAKMFVSLNLYHQEIREMLDRLPEEKRPMSDLWDRVTLHKNINMWEVLSTYTINTNTSFFGDLFTSTAQWKSNSQRPKMELLLKMGFDVNYKDETGKNALSHLVSENHVCMINKGETESLYTWIRKQGATSTNLLFDAFNGQTKKQREEQDEKNRIHYEWLSNQPPNQTPMAALPQHDPFYNRTTLAYLLASGEFDIHGRNEHGMTLLHWAISEGNYEKIEMLLKHDISIMSDLLVKSEEGEHAYDAITKPWMNLWSMEEWNDLPIQRLDPIQRLLDEKTEEYNYHHEQCIDAFDTVRRFDNVDLSFLGMPSFLLVSL